MGDSDRDSGGGQNGNNQNGQSSLSPREQDRFLPIANVSRIMKKALPANAKISKDAKETMQECVSEFISFVTGEASDKCQKEKRKTINGDDLLWAMTTLGFEDYVEPLKVYLQRFREIEGERTGLGRPQTGGEVGEHQRDAVGDGGGFYGGGGGMQYHQHLQFLHQQNHMYGATGGGSDSGGGAASGRTRT